MAVSDCPIAELKERVRKLGLLLDDPHPGLMTWNIALFNALKAVQYIETGEVTFGRDLS